MIDDSIFRKRLREELDVEKSLFKPSRETIKSIEKDIGLSLPDDYRELLSEIGVGSWGGAINMRLPNPEFLETSLLMIHEEYPAESFFPEEGGYIPWAESGSRLVFCWKIAGGETQIGCFEVGFSPKQFKVSFSEFLAAQFMLTNNKKMQIFDLSAHLFVKDIES